jgi:hypothetical protein
MNWDVFISHASEDRAAVARPLAERLRKRGLRVWLDEQELFVGDSLRRKIDDGLARSRWGVVILSPHFLAKEWPQAELDSLFSREIDGSKVILPVWHQISATELAGKSPLIAARLAVDTKRGIDGVCDAILRATSQETIDIVRPVPKTPDILAYWSTLETKDHSSYRGLIESLSNRKFYEGERIGDYKLLEYIGSGGSGVVFKAMHRGLGTVVALKLFYPVDSQYRSLIHATERAVRGLATLRHRSIAALHDFGFLEIGTKWSAYLVNDLVQGVDLLTWTRSIPFVDPALTRRLKIAIQTADALHAAHICNYIGDLGFRETGVLHGDVKPANILVGRAEVPIIVDFMIPDLQRVVFGFTDHWVKRDDGTYFYNSPLTAAYGTPGYMPPEQLVEGIVTAPSDVYALGRTFVDLFWANEEEFSRDLMSKTGVKAVNRQLAHLVKQMTRPQPEERPQSMREITEALQRLSGGIKRNWVGDFGRLFRRRRGF